MPKWPSPRPPSYLHRSQWLTDGKSASHAHGMVRITNQIMIQFWLTVLSTCADVLAGKGTALPHIASMDSTFIDKSNSLIFTFMYETLCNYPKIIHYYYIIMDCCPAMSPSAVTASRRLQVTLMTTSLPGDMRVAWQLCDVNVCERV